MMVESFVINLIVVTSIVRSGEMVSASYVRWVLMNIAVLPC